MVRIRPGEPFWIALHRPVLAISGAAGVVWGEGMKRLFTLSLAALLIFGTASAVPAHPPLFVANSSRNIAGGHAVYVLVPRSELKSEIKESNFNGMGGLLFGIVAAAQDASRTKK